MRKFEILSITEVPSGDGTTRMFKVSYKAIRKKQWVEKSMLIIAKNAESARAQCITRFGD